MLAAAVFVSSAFTIFPGARAQSQPGFDLLASYDRPGLPVPHWQMHISPNGEVVYTSERTSVSASVPNGPTEFKLSGSGAAKLQELLDASHDMQPCETKSKGLARMGMKSLQYRKSPDAPAVQCTYNYTDNKPLSLAAEYLIAISMTVEQGATLEHMHRYDRLGLDPVMTQLATAYKAGQAKEIQAIRPTLVSLVNDDAVLERVRQKASELLAVTDHP